MFRIHLLAIALLVAAAGAHAQPYGLDAREENTAILIDDPTSPPARLSDLPALLTLAHGGQVPGVIPYAPHIGFWSDGSGKWRHIALPGLEQITYRDDVGWDFPRASILIKNFDLPLVDGDPDSAKLIETRLLIKDDTEWRGYSYRWNEEETDAELLDTASFRSFTIQTDDGPLNYTWVYPSRFDCTRCHTAQANGALGPQTLQMNAPFTYPQTGVTDNQLRTYDHIGLFAGDGLPAAPGELPALPSLDDTAAGAEALAKAWLHVNCSFCHQPGEETPVSIDLRFDTPVGEMNVVDAVPQRGFFGNPANRIILPGAPENSVLYLRITSLDHRRMPPLASSRVDEQGAALIRAWIEELGLQPGWEHFVVR